MEIEILQEKGNTKELKCSICGKDLFLRYNSNKYPLISVFFNNAIKYGSNISSEEKLGQELLKRMGNKSGVYSGIDCLNFLRVKGYYIKPYYRKPKHWF